MKRDYTINEYGVELLCYHILRRAFQDYYECCIFQRKLPRRPMVKEIIKGKQTRRKMTDHEFHLWLVDREKRRKGRVSELLRFFTSEWYYKLSDRMDEDYRNGLRDILSMIEWKRENGLPLFDKRFVSDDDEMED